MSANLGRPQVDEHTIKQKNTSYRLNFDDAEEFVAPRMTEIGVHLFFVMNDMSHLHQLAAKCLFQVFFHPYYVEDAVPSKLHQSLCVSVSRVTISIT